MASTSTRSQLLANNRQQRLKFHGMLQYRHTQLKSADMQLQYVKDIEPRFKDFKTAFIQQNRANVLLRTKPQFAEAWKNASKEMSVTDLGGYTIALTKFLDDLEGKVKPPTPERRTASATFRPRSTPRSKLQPVPFFTPHRKAQRTVYPTPKSTSATTGLQPLSTPTSLPPVTSRKRKAEYVVLEDSDSEGTEPDIPLRDICKKARFGDNFSEVDLFPDASTTKEMTKKEEEEENGSAEVASYNHELI